MIHIEHDYQQEIYSTDRIKDLEKQTKIKLLQIDEEADKSAKTIHQFNVSQPLVEEILDTESTDEFDSLWEEFSKTD